MKDSIIFFIYFIEESLGEQDLKESANLLISRFLFDYFKNDECSIKKWKWGKKFKLAHCWESILSYFRSDSSGKKKRKNNYFFND